MFSSLITKNFIGRKKRYRWKGAQNLYSGMQIMTARTTTSRTLYVHIVLNGMIFPQISYDIVPYARHFLPVRYFTKYYFIKLCIQLPQNVTSLRADENVDDDY